MDRMNNTDKEEKEDSIAVLHEKYRKEIKNLDSRSLTGKMS